MQEQDEPAWLRSPFSGQSGCVEIASLTDGQVGLRNSRDLAAPVHVFTRREWDAFLQGVKRGSFDQI